MKDQYPQGSSKKKKKIETLPKDINQSHLEINLNQFTPNQ